MADYALIEDGIVQNIIVVDDEDWLDEYCKENNFTAVDIDSLDYRIAHGYIRQEGNGAFIPPEEIKVDVSTIPPDGTTAATVEYRNNHNDAPNEVTFTINGAEQSPVVVGADGWASIQVASNQPGDIVTIQAGQLSLAIQVEES